MPLQDVPIELAEHILTFCHVRDVARISQTCKQLHALIYGGSDQFLWRELFLLYPFDDLRKAVPAKSLPRRTSSSSSQRRGADDDGHKRIDWRGTLQRRVFAETIAVLDPSLVHAEDFISVLATLVSVVHSALPYQPAAPGQLSQPPSHNFRWLRDVLQRSPAIRTRTISGGPQHQYCCQLRAYLSLSLHDEPTADSDLLKATRSVSRCAVYTLGNYTVRNMWGPYLPLTAPSRSTPFTPSSSPSTPSSSPPSPSFIPAPLPFFSPLDAQPKVDWVQVEHIMNVVVMNMRDLEQTPYSLMRPQLGLDAMRAYSAPGTGNLRESASKDWAGLEGLWRRFVCFMDYRELFAFNFSNLKASLSPAYFDDPNFIEAVRLLEMRISLTSVDDPTEFDYPGCPQLHFGGYVRGLQSRNAEVKGFIQRFLDGSIRWKFETIYDGVSQWSGECIQLGNVCSAAGLAGIWSGVQHTAGDPAGPFLMWKIGEATWLDRERDQR